ncbi:MAG: hypothetical protein HN816_08475, partial [Gammaproteobacteria bacterium]|nr:hypothetical protein [Gammaproteobacteria bacterium]
QSEGDINATNAANAIGSLSITEGDAVTISNNGALQLKSVNVAALELTTAGAVTDTSTDTVTVAGLLDIDPGGNDITLLKADLGALAIVNANDVSVSEANSVELRDIVAASFSVTAVDDVTQFAGTGVTITNQFDLVGQGDIILDGTNAFGSIQIDGNNVVLEGSGDIDLETIDAITLTVSTAGGNIEQQVGTNTTVTGLATFETVGGDITLTDPNNSYGSISLTGTNVEFETVSAIEVEGIDASTLIFTAGGNITGSGEVNVSGDATFDAGNADLKLTNANNSIATLSVTAGAVDLTLVSDVELDQLDVTNIFDLTAGGEITDASSAAINVGQAILDATGDITLGDSGSVDLQVLNLTGANIDITVSGSAEIEKISGEDLSLTAAGEISQSADSDIDVNSAKFSNAGNNIILPGNDNTLGSVEIVSAGEVEITNTSGITLNDINADSLILITGGAVADGGKVNIAGELNINAGTSDILLNQNTHAFESLAVVGGEVRLIDGSGDTTLLGVDVDILELSTTGDVTGVEEIRVDEDLEITADDGVGQIRLTNSLNRLNKLSLTGSSVEVVNSLGSELVDISASTLTLTSGGDVTDSADDEIIVTGKATIVAAEGFDVLLGSNANDNVSIGSVELTGDRVFLTQTGDVAIESISAASDLRVTSLEGGINAESGATVTAGGDATFAVNRDNADIDISNATSNFGSLGVVGRDVVITETDGTLLTGVLTDNFTLSSGGNITNSDRAEIDSVVLGDLTATGDIILGHGIADSVNFGRLSLTATNASVIESSGTLFAGLNISDNFTMQSDGAMLQVGSSTGDEDAVLTVGGLATLIVEGESQQILFDGLSNSFGSLDLTSENITINLADSTVISNLVADNVVLNAPVGIISVVNSGNFVVDRSADLRARRIIFNEDSNIEVGSLALSTRSGGAVEIKSDINPRLILGNPSNAAGTISITSPDVFLGVDGGAVNIATVGGPDGGSVAISGVNASGLPDATAGTVHIAGTVTVDTTDGGSSEGANVTMVSDASGAGAIRIQDGVSAGLLHLTAGAGSVDLGNFLADARLGNFTVNSANDVFLDDVYLAGNTLDITATGIVSISGVVDDGTGSISIQSGGAIDIAQSATAAGTITLVSENDSVTVQEVTAGGNVIAAADQNLMLGANTTASNGTVTLLSAGSITSIGTITSSGDTTVLGTNDVTLGSSGIQAVTSGGDVTITADAGDVTVSDVSATGDAIVFSVSGKVTQEQNTVLDAGGDAIVSAETGIEIATIQAANNVTLVVNQDGVNADGSTPTFSRVNGPIPLGQGDTNQDVRSTNGTIVFLAPVADVGSAAVDQNFVQRAGGGIFYGLDQGSFFSDDIGSTNILNGIPSDTQTNLDAALSKATAFTLSDQINVNVADPVTIDINFFSQNLVSAFNATASAGETNAASSSRSTAASQGDEDEEVAEVDELAFQNLKNYEENPQGILLPEDQIFAYDDDGNVYLIVTLTGQTQGAPAESFTLYKVELDPGIEKSLKPPMKPAPQMYGYRPAFMRMNSASGED